MNGALLNGNRVDGVTHVMNILAERYGQLGQELRLKVIKDFLDFDRKHHESIDDLLTRFEIAKTRATELGNFDMSIEGVAHMLLRACRVSDQQFTMLTQPTGGLFRTKRLNTVLSLWRCVGYDMLLNTVKITLRQD